MKNFNEGTNTLLYKNISLILYSRKGWCWLCVRGELETGTDCYILTQVLLTVATLLPHLGWGCSTVGHWGPKALCQPLALNSAPCLQLTPTPTDSSPLCPGYIFVWRPSASTVFPLIFTGLSLDWRLGRGSICYTTIYPQLGEEQMNTRLFKCALVCNEIRSVSSRI